MMNLQSASTFVGIAAGLLRAACRISPAPIGTSSAGLTGQPFSVEVQWPITDVIR